MGARVLDIRNLTKSYEVSAGFGKRKKQRKPALVDVSFRLEAGLYGILGPNGAGKSTLLNIITGSLRQDGGRVLWQNSLRPASPGFRRILGYMPQQQKLYDNFKGGFFLEYFAALKEIPPRERQEEIQRVAAAVNLTAEMDKKLHAYSGGMKQRLLAAVAILGSPQLIVLDEPTAGLDPKERVRLRETMAEIAKNAVVILATHVVSDVESVANKILLLKEGRLVDVDTPQNLMQKHGQAQSLESVYLDVFGEDAYG